MEINKNAKNTYILAAQCTYKLKVEADSSDEAYKIANNTPIDKWTHYSYLDDIEIIDGPDEENI